jgi:hypothetical protein
MSSVAGPDLIWCPLGEKHISEKKCAKTQIAKTHFSENAQQRKVKLRNAK